MRGLLRSPLFALLRPGWPDEARRMVQEPVFGALARKAPLRGRCLNAGCGEGLYTPFLDGLSGVASVVDMDLNAPVTARVRSGGRHPALAGDMTALPFAAASFDSVLCSEVLEHVSDDRAAVRELARVTRSGGTLLMSVPTPPAPFDPEHVREGYRVGELTSLLEAAGFEVLESRVCFHAFMRLLLVAWRWQSGWLGRGRSRIPRAAIRFLGFADRHLRIGRPCDLVVVARRR